MGSEKLQEWLNSTLKEIKHERFEGCVEVIVEEFKPLSVATAVVVSQIFSLRITLKYVSGETASFHAVAKMEPSHQMCQFTQDHNLFNNEIMVYKQVISLMESLKLENGDDKEQIWPICFHCGNNTLLMENLCEKNYAMVKTEKLLNLDQIGLALKSLGEFHGLFRVLIEKGDINANLVKPIIYAKKENNYMIPTFSATISSVANLIKTKWGSEWSHVPDKLTNCQSNLGDKLADLANSLQGKFDVMCHGDFTMRNMMFSHDENGKPLKVKFLDFQSCCYNNPAFDLVLFLHSSMKPQTRDDNIVSLLNIYTESLCATCKRYNYKGTIPCLEDVTSWYKELSFYGMVTSLFALPVFLATGLNDFIPDLQQSEEDIKKFSIEFMRNSLYKSEETNETLKYIINRCVEENII